MEPENNFICMDVPDNDEFYLNNNGEGAWYSGVNAT